MNHPILIATAALAAFTGFASAATIPFEEDFNDNVASGFSTSSGWSAANQRYEVDFTGSGSTRASTVDLTNADGVPVVMSAEFTMSSIDGNVGFVAYGAGSSSDPFYLIDFDDAGSLRIFEIASSNTSLGSGTVNPGQSFSLNDTYTLEATFTPSGGGLDIDVELLDGSTVISSASGSDATPLTGDAFGFRGRTSTSSGSNSITGFADNFSVTVVPEPTSALAIAAGVGGLLMRRRK